MSNFIYKILLFFILTTFAFSSFSSQQYNLKDNDHPVYDYPLKEDLHLPEWFSLSFLDLQESLDDAIKEGKKGIIVYFGRKDCAYCQALLEVNWGDPAIKKFTQKNYSVIAINVRGDRMVTDFNGKNWSEKDFSNHKKTNFTPSLLFYNSKGQLALKLSGYRPKYQFRAALEYVADAHYMRESFRSYLSRGEKALSFGLDELNDNALFLPPPYNLDRSKISAKKPLVVFFEHIRCHACDVLHGGALSAPKISKLLPNLDMVQINGQEDTPVITPQGKHTTAKEWADELNLSFAPTMIFFDTQGKEVLRVDSVIRFHRLNNVLRYILSKGYLGFETFQDWLYYNKTQQPLTQ